MTTVEKLPAQQLPVPVLEHPHWRITFRPPTYDEHRVPTLSDCLEIVSRNRVRLRGWDFPPVPPHVETEDGPRWIAGWSDFDKHFEYWRFYQSTQFLYLGSVNEFTDPKWQEQLRQSRRFRDEPGITGLLSITNFIFSITEIFEFATRLVQAEVYRDPIEIGIRLNGIQGFALAPERGGGKAWSQFSAREPELDFQKTVPPLDLVAKSADLAVDCIVWFFERFGWMNPSLDLIRMDQQRLLTQKF